MFKNKRIYNRFDQGTPGVRVVGTSGRDYGTYDTKDEAIDKAIQLDMPIWQGSLKPLEVVYDPQRDQRTVEPPQTFTDINGNELPVNPIGDMFDAIGTMLANKRAEDNVEEQGRRNRAADKGTHAMSVYEGDQRARELTPSLWELTGEGTVVPVMNFMSPSQQVGALIDMNQGEGYWQSIFNGNSGIVSDNFMRNHPVLGMTANLGLDAATYWAGNKAYNYMFGPIYERENINKLSIPLSRASKNLRDLKNELQYIFYVKTPYLADISDPVGTYRAIKNGTYLPFISQRGLKAHNIRLQRKIRDEVVPSAIDRTLKRTKDLSDIYEAPLTTPWKEDFIEDTHNNIKYHVGTYNQLKLPRGAAGLQSGKDIYLPINNYTFRHRLFPKNKFLGVASHEAEHVSQDILGMESPLLVKEPFLKTLNKTLKDPVYIARRTPVVDWDYPINDSGKIIGPKYSGVFTGESQGYHNNVLYNDDYGDLWFSFRDPSFDILAKRNINHTWESSPKEVQSEVARYIDYTIGERGKLYKDLTIEQQDRLDQLIAKRFNLSTKESSKMLTEASDSGYLANGGFINKR